MKERCRVTGMPEELWATESDSEKAEEFAPRLIEPVQPKSVLLDPEQETQGPRIVGTPVPPAEQENVEAAVFILKELLETPRYSQLKLTDNQLDSLAWEATAMPLPSGAKRIDTVVKRLKRFLHATKLDAKANSCARTKPKRGRFRPTLCYDHKPRLAPSTAVNHPGSLSAYGEDRPMNDNPEAEYIAALDRKQGSESEDSVQQAQPLGMNFTEGGGPLRLRLAIVKALKSPAQGCSRCGTLIPADKPRSTILRVDQPTAQEIDTITHLACHCKTCRGSSVPEQNDRRNAEEESWINNLTSDELHAYRLKREGLNQTEIGKRMSPMKSQETVSRILKRVEKKLGTTRLAQYQKTGGA